MSIKKCIGVIKGAAKEGKIDDAAAMDMLQEIDDFINNACLLYTSPSPRD